MKKFLIPLLGLLLASPVVVALFLAWQSAEDQAQRGEKGLEISIESLLKGRSQGLVNELNALETELEALLNKVYQEKTAVQDAFPLLARKHPWIRQAFSLTPKGELSYPLREKASSREMEFLLRMDMVLSAFSTGHSQEGEQVESTQGWFFWFWREGQQYLFWWKNPDGNIWGLDLERYAVLARLLEPLIPPFEFDGIPNAKTIFLTTPDGRTFYQWGSDIEEYENTLWLRVPLEEPFSGWHFEVHKDLFMTQKTEEAWKTGFYWASGLMAIFFAFLVGLVLYALFHSFREASLRQSFVNQVSHELKTPLTNIRLYAELLEKRLQIQGAEPRSLDFLQVILNESLRLSRLIHNVLTFSRREKGNESQPEVLLPDDVVRDVVRSFQLSLTHQGMEVVFDLNTPKLLKLDKGKLEQILGNLISNGEKYASTGKTLTIRTNYSSGWITLEVIDNGPGIPVGQEEKIFLPFIRLKTKLSDGAGGTGLGLTISRELARAEGGNLEILQSKEAESGACFRLTLPAEEIDE